jgi:hypothetical protein
LATTKGFCIRFNEDEVRPIGLVAAGVAGIKLGVGDEVVNISTINRDHLVVLLTTDGRAKRTPAKDYPTQGRYGMGVIGWKMTPGKHIAGMMVGENTEKFIVHFMKSISKPKKVEEIPQAGRAAQGKMVLEVKPGDQVIGITTIWDGVGKKAKHSKEDPETGKRSGKYESNLQLELFKPEKRARSSAKKEPKLQSPKKDTARTKTVSKPVRKVTKPKSINKAVSKDKNTSSKPKRTSTYRMTSTKTKPTTKVESEVKPQTGRGRPKKTP